MSVARNLLGPAAALAVCLGAGPTTAALVPSRPFGVFVSGEALDFACGTGAERTYRVTDWRGRSVAEGTCGADGALTLQGAYLGYFTLAVTGDAKTETTTFLVVRLPKRTPGADGFFGADSAQSWTERTRLVCPWYGGDMHRALSETAGRIGLRHIRDRLSRTAVEPTPQARTTAIETFRSAGLLASNGVETCTDIDGTPSWAGPIDHLPRDLASLYAFCRWTAATFRDRTANWEIFNEQDACGASEPVWDYAAAQKAAFLGLKAGNPACTVLPGAVCLNTRGVYDEGMYANDLAYYGDVFNLHIYLAPAAFPTAFDDLRRFFDRIGLPPRDVWITENGMDLEGPAAAASCVPGLHRHSAAQELLQAEYYPKSQIALMMGGASRGYFFFFGSYHERDGAKDWGTFRRDGTPKVVLAAMATATRELGDATLLGAVDLGADARGFLFSHPNGTRTLAFWSASPVDTGRGWALGGGDLAREISVRVELGDYRLSDLCGSAARVTATRGQALALPATRYPAYLHGTFDLPVAARAHPRGRCGATQAPAGTDLSVVFRVDLDRNDFGITRGKTAAELKRPSGRLTVQAWNLSETAKTGTVTVAGATLKGVPARLVLPPFGKAEFPAELALAAGQGETVLRLAGRFGTCATTVLSMPVVHLDEDFLARCRVVTLTGACNPTQWKLNDSATRHACTYESEEKALHFHYEWDDPQTDRWFYPQCRLDLPRESLADALMLEFEVKSAQDKVENDYNVANLLLGTFLAYPPPMKDWETRRIAVTGLNPGATSFGLGGNPRGLKVDYWIRNLRLIKKHLRDHRVRVHRKFPASHAGRLHHRHGFQGGLR